MQCAVSDTTQRTKRAEGSLLLVQSYFCQHTAPHHAERRLCWTRVFVEEKKDNVGLSSIFKNIRPDISTYSRPYVNTQKAGP